MHNPDFERIGKRLFTEHLVGASFGNMSVRKADEGFFYQTGQGVSRYSGRTDFCADGG